MGANATTKVPSYAAGQVLTAADLSITNSGIPVFANSTDRTNSFGGTGEKTLAEGQFAYLEDDNKTYYYDGAAWKEVGAAAGLTLISNTAHSAASTVSVDNVFSSTYTNYRLIWQSSFSASLTPTMRFRAGGTATTSSYAFQFVIGSSTTVTANRGTAQANLDIFGGASAGPLLAIYDIYGPNLAANTAGSGTVNMLYGGNLVHHNYSIAQQGTTQFDGVEINASANNMTGNLWIYGYRKDV